MRNVHDCRIQFNPSDKSKNTKVAKLNEELLYR